MNLQFNIKCTLCGNVKDSEFYVMPMEYAVKDGKVYSNKDYNLVCKKCNQKHILRFNIFVEK